ncbi:MAG TPA: UDP-N-acetylmuramate dehydrogenase [Desulfuromonadaceae bacterium]|jgi:UDP-N-acetylmuramate dehydrogenase
MIVPDFKDIPLVIEENVPLAPFTSFGIGGPARYFTSISNAEELRAALYFVQQRGLSHFILAGGTNILVSDQGFNGLVIKMGLDAVDHEGNVITAQAGAELGRVVERATDLSLSGIESLAGIPGTVGGAVRGNAGAFGTSIAELVKKVLVVDVETFELLCFSRDECQFDYRNSIFKSKRSMVVVAVDLALSEGHLEEIRQNVKHTLEKRSVITEKERSVGSYFINPIPSDDLLIKKFETDRQIRCRNCMIPAGWLIDQANLRGTRVGGAMISEKHGNYLINDRAATATDVLNLAELVKRKVREKMGVELQEEVNYVGF